VNSAEARPFPNWHFLFQFIYYPLRCLKRFLPVLTGDSQEERSFACSNESDSVMNNNQLKSEFCRSLPGNLSQLVLCHLAVRFIFDSVDLTSMLKSADYAREIDNRAGAEDMILRRVEWCLGQQNFAKGICHLL
jgi:hypothetical protein